MTKKKLQKPIHKYAWKPDIPDARDLIYKRKWRLFRIPQIVDLRPMCSPVEDQGQIGSCTATAIVGNLEYLENKEGLQMVDLSRLFVYYNERMIEGTTDHDAGAMIRDGIKSLITDGVCPESEWGYDITKFTNKPTKQCYNDALAHRISQYQRLNTIDDIQSCLADGYPVVVGISVYESFESDDVAKTGIVPMPTADERLLGGHAVLVVGYDMAKRWFIVRNSWGDNWGDNGYFYLPFDYMSNQNLSDDWWSISKF